jgi:hypothetical protein
LTSEISKKKMDEETIEKLTKENEVTKIVRELDN